MGVNPAPRRIVVEIDELVLAGFPPVNRDLVASAFHRELARLLRQDDTDFVASARDDVPGVALPARPSTSRGLGEAIARAVHTGLTGEAAG